MSGRGTVHKRGPNKECEEGTGGCCSVASSCFDVFDSIGVFNTSEGCSVLPFFFCLFFFFFFFFLLFFLLFLLGEVEIVDSNDDSLASRFDTSNAAIWPGRDCWGSGLLCCVNSV